MVYFYMNGCFFVIFQLFYRLHYETPVEIIRTETEREEEDDPIQYIAKEYWHIVGSGRHSTHIQTGLTIEVVDTQDNIILCIDVLMGVDHFFRFPIQTAKQYMIDLATDYGDTVVIFAADLEDAIRLYGLTDVYDSPVILKTHYIRLIQRKWRRLYAEKMRKWRERGSLLAQKHFELTGNYRYHLSSVIKYKN